MAADKEYVQSLIDELRKETNERLRRQDHTISKLERKIDKLQQTNHAQMQTLDVRMQQMMGMFQMFMMNQTIGMNQNQQSQNQNNAQQDSPSPVALNLDTTNLGVSNKQITKSRSQGNIENTHRHRVPLKKQNSEHKSSEYMKSTATFSDSEYETDDDKGRDRSKSRRKHRSKKQRKKEKKEKRKHKKREKKDKKRGKSEETSDFVQIFEKNDVKIEIPAPPKPFDGAIRNRASTTSSNGTPRRVPPPPPRESRKDKKKRDRKHHQSRSVNVKNIINKKQRPQLQKAESMEAPVDYVPIKHGKQSPSLSDSRTLFDHLQEIELDIETPSDEESLIYVREEDMKSDDSDIDQTYDWNKQRNNKANADNEDSGDDDISLLSAQKKLPGIGDEDLGDSDYSDVAPEDDANGSSEERNEDDSDNEGSSSHEDEQNLSKSERKRRKKERKKRKKKEKKRRKKKRKEAKKRKIKEQHRKDAKKSSASLELSKTRNDGSISAKLDDETPTMSDQSSGKRKKTLTGKIKKIGQKFKIGFKEKDDCDSDSADSPKIMKEDEVSADYKIRPNPLNKSSTLKDMFKGKGKKHRKDGSYIEASYDSVVGKEERIISPRKERAHTFHVHDDAAEKKKSKRFGALRGFRKKSLDDGDRKGKKLKKRDSKPRRGSDSNLSAMSHDFEFSAGRMKKGKKKKKFSLNASDLLQPDYDGDVTPPPSPGFDALLGPKIDEVDEESDDFMDSNPEIELNDTTSDNRRTSKHSSIDDYTKVGSKSNSKDIGLITDIDPENDALFSPGNESVATDYDPDIDVGDYDWTSYGNRTSTLQVLETQSDDDNNSKLDSLSPKLQKEIRPQSARTPSPPSKGKKGQNKFFAANKKTPTQKKKKKLNGDDENKPIKLKKKGSLKGNAKKKSKKTDDKKKKTKNISVITEDKKLKISTAKMSAPNTPSQSKRRKNGPDTPTIVNKKKKAPKKRNSAKLGRSKKKTSPNGTNDEAKECDFLQRNRGQSLHRARGQCVSHLFDENTTNGTMEMEYVFANKKLKCLMPKIGFDKYENESEKPKHCLKLEHIIGYNGHDKHCRNNLFSLKNQTIVYSTEKFVVLHDLSKNEQNIYKEHSSPITSITLHPNKHYVASSSSSENKATIKIWDTKQQNDTLFEIASPDIIQEVRHLTFSPVSALLYFTCGEKQKNTQLIAFSLKSLQSPIINIKFKTVNAKIVKINGMIFNPKPDQSRYNDEFLVFGSNILYWCQSTDSKDGIRYCKVNKLQPKSSTDGKKEKGFHCGLFLKDEHANNAGYYLLGGSSGTIYFGHENTIIAALPGHNGRVQSIEQFSANQFLSTGYDGMWKVWSIDYDNAKIAELSANIAKQTENGHMDDAKEDEHEFESKRVLADYSNKIIKSSAIKVLCEESFVPSNDNVSKHPHACHYDMAERKLYIGTTCNSILSLSNINIKNCDNDLQIIASGHNEGIVGCAISPKLDSLIATLSNDGLLRLWNIANRFNANKKNGAKRFDQCVAFQSLISSKHSSKLKATALAWSPGGHWIAAGYNVSKVSLCTAHPLKKVQEIDLSQYKLRGKAIKAKEAITALCFSYNGILAVAHSTQLSLFNINAKKCIKWDLTLTEKEIIRHLYFSEDDDLLCVVTEKYETKFYNISMKKMSILETNRLPKPEVSWWPRLPLTSYILKGLYQKDAMQWNSNELIDSDICQPLKIAASADQFGVVRLHKLPALNEMSHHSYQNHHGVISKLQFISDPQRLISIGFEDRSIITWNIE